MDAEANNNPLTPMDMNKTEQDIMLLRVLRFVTASVVQ